jgi:hypothetical protein
MPDQHNRTKGSAGWWLNALKWAGLARPGVSAPSAAPQKLPLIEDVVARIRREPPEVG